MSSLIELLKATVGLCALLPRMLISVQLECAHIHYTVGLEFK